MNALKFALSATAALVLAACGNGGTYQPDLTNTPTVNPKPSAPSANAGGDAGGSSSANNAGGTSSGSPATGGGSAGSQPNTGNAGTQPSTPPAGSGNATAPSTGNTAGSQPNAGNNTPSAPSGKYTGHFVSGNTALQGESKMLATDDYSQISINGVVIPLPAGTSEAGFPIRQPLAYPTLSVAKNLKHVVYGFAQNYEGLPDGTHFAFVQGEESKSVPASGKVKYQGSANFFNNLNAGSGLKVDYGGMAELSVDFGKKTLEGQVESAFGNVPLSATIKGSKFEGTDEREGWETKGAFYGPDAAEVAGTFRNLKNQTNPTIGAFGAKKVAQ